MTARAESRHRHVIWPGVRAQDRPMVAQRVVSAHVAQCHRRPAWDRGRVLMPPRIPHGLGGGKAVADPRRVGRPYSAFGGWAHIVALARTTSPDLRCPEGAGHCERRSMPWIDAIAVAVAFIAVAALVVVLMRCRRAARPCVSGSGAADAHSGRHRQIARSA
jgi:hypothetical protein